MVRTVGMDIPVILPTATIAPDTLPTPAIIARTWDIEATLATVLTPDIEPTPAMRISPLPTGTVTAIEGNNRGVIPAPAGTAATVILGVGEGLPVAGPAPTPSHSPPLASKTRRPPSAAFRGPLCAPLSRAALRPRSDPA